jgi:hypothetical protein
MRSVELTCGTAPAGARPRRGRATCSTRAFTRVLLSAAASATLWLAALAAAMTASEQNIPEHQLSAFLSACYQKLHLSNNELWRGNNCYDSKVTHDWILVPQLHHFWWRIYYATASSVDLSVELTWGARTYVAMGTARRHLNRRRRR